MVVGGILFVKRDVMGEYRGTMLLDSATYILRHKPCGVVVGLVELCTI